MTKTQELLELARVALGGVTDYKLAKTLGLPRARVCDYRAGRRQADAYAAAQLALLLKRDPLAVIAEVEAESARSKPAREFWARFPSGLRRTALGAGLLAICGTSALGPRTGEAGSLEPASHNGRLRQRHQRQKSKIHQNQKRKDAARRGGFFMVVDPAPNPQEKQAPRQKKRLSRHPLIFPAHSR